MPTPMSAPQGDAPQPPTSANGRMLALDPATLTERFNRRPFSFGHGLAGHPLFETDRLLRLARSMPPGTVGFNAGNAAAGSKWRDLGKTAPTVEDAIERIEVSGSWVIFKHVEHDPEYRELLNRSLTELSETLGRPVRAGATDIGAFIFLASPKAVTPFHIDAECSLLYQIRGNKDFHIFDPRDRAVLSRPEIERFYVGDLESAQYKPEFQDRAEVVKLAPGVGVHIPVLAGHWVQNEDNVSVSFTTCFVTPFDRARRRIYHANHVLRKVLRVDASDPGSSPMWDTARSVAGRAAMGAFALRRKVGSR